MPRENADDKEDQTRPDAAALFRHLDAQARQMERKPLPEYRDTRKFEDPVGNLCGKDLQQEDDPLHQKTGDRNHEKKEQEGEKSEAGWFQTLKQDKPSDPTVNRREGHHGEEVVLIEPHNEFSPDKVKSDPDNNENASGNKRGAIILKYFPPSGEYQI